MDRPKLLDLFCGAGGAAMGYHRAGFEVIGVDIKPQPHFPFTFIQADAMTYPLGGFDAIHASPPCQAYSLASAVLRKNGKEYPDLLAATRERLLAADVPWVIENVPGAPMRADFLLCGSHFRLPLVRHRLFMMEPRPDLVLLPPCQHPEIHFGVYGNGVNSWLREKRRKAGLHPNPTVSEFRAAMGINWMSRASLSQAIPPAYTEFIGITLMKSLDKRLAHPLE